MSILDGITREQTKPITATNPGFSVAGRVRTQKGSPDPVSGELVYDEPSDWNHNVLCTYGLASMASMIGSAAANNASAWIQAIYIGTSQTGASSTDTQLGASTASITMGNANFTKTNTGNMTVEYDATFASSNVGGSYTVNEVGLYCNSTGANESANKLAAHANLATSVVRGASDVIQISYQIVFTTA